MTIIGAFGFAYGKPQRLGERGCREGWRWGGVGSGAHAHLRLLPHPRGRAAYGNDYKGNTCGVDKDVSSRKYTVYPRVNEVCVAPVLRPWPLLAVNRAPIIVAAATAVLHRHPPHPLCPARRTS
jgi:hypothetical protein